MSRVYLSPPHLTGEEVHYLQQALDTNWIAPVGPHLQAFEREVCERIGVPHGLAVSSGTAALHLALQVIGVEAGDEVWSPTLTFVGAVNPIRYLGATPVFVDSDMGSWNMDPNLLTDALKQRAKENRLPKAVIVVHLYGETADMDPIVQVCREYGVLVVEDAAEALGAEYDGRPAGGLGDIGILSFNGNKIVTTSGGGMVVSRNQQWIERAFFFATQARQPGLQYLHNEMGYNYRLSNLLAGVGRAQLKNLDKFIVGRGQINATYRRALEHIPGVAFMPTPPWSKPNHWLTCLTIDPAQAPWPRDELCERFAAADIEVRPVWKPMHRQPLYTHCELLGGAVADRLEDTGLCLPSSSILTRNEQERVIGVFTTKDSKKGA